MKKDIYWFVDWDCLVAAKEISSEYENLYGADFYHKKRETAEMLAKEVKKIHQRQHDKLHDFQWALQKLQEGLRVKRLVWGEFYPSHIYFDPREKEIKEMVIANDGSFYPNEVYLSSYDILANDWVLYHGK